MTRIAMRVKKRPALRARIGGWTSDRRVTGEFLARVGLRVERRARRLAPVDTGRLRASLGTAWRGHRARVGSPAKARDAIRTPRRRNVVWVGSNVAYARHVHERHPTRGRFLERAMSGVKRDLQDEGRRFRSGK